MGDLPLYEFPVSNLEKPSCRSLEGGSEMKLTQTANGESQLDEHSELPAYQKPASA
jgi:hypothetical protein